MRLFFALWTPRETAAALHAWASEAQRLTGGRVTRAETIHLTLAFLGEVEEGLVPGLKSLSVNGRRHELPIEHAGCWTHNSIVWAGPREIPAELKVVVSSLRENLLQQKFKPEKRPFAAHVTLIRKARKAAELPPLPAVGWPVEELVLVRSQLSSAGPRYQVIERFPLSPGPSGAGSGAAPES